MALRLFGVMQGNGKLVSLPAGVEVFKMRGLAAAVEPAVGVVREVAPGDVNRYRAVVQALSADRAMLPAPVGTTFRSPDVLKKWMDVHYVALSDALAWVGHRVAARVHVKAGSAQAALVEDVTRQLGGRAVATLLLPQSPDGTHTAAYLVEREVWKPFLAAVEQVNDRYDELRAEATGPWPPYDFVRLQFTP